MKIKNYLLLGLLITGTLFSGCGDDDVPGAEEEEEIIDKMTLTFTPVTEGATVTAVAFDPDGEGVQNFQVEEIDLAAGTAYTLSILLENTVEDENISDEIEEEDEEHMFFFSFTNELFSDPTGNGNVDNRADALNYNDEDENTNPVGLSTSWTTKESTSTDGSFRVILKHQPNGIKSAISTSVDGETDIDINWTLNVN
ncbi:MAG: hypothetical protein GY816_01590 [Cytophagales bacterium]|nr:hypothetical protein [Cytophagales bacterium]